MVHADKVVIAAGVHTGRLLADSGLDAGLPPILAGRGVSLLLNTGEPLPAAIRTPNREFACGAHLVPRSNGVYLGATNRLTLRPHPRRRPTLDEIGTLIHDGASEINTSLRDAELVSMRVGYRPYTLDHLPLVGRTHHPRVLVATATYRTGVLLAPHLANLIADEIENPGATANHPYAPTRTMPTPDLVDLLDGDGALALVHSIMQPGGHLPPGSDVGLATLIRLALPALLGNPVPGQAAAMLNRLWTGAPVEEAIAQLHAAITRLP